MRTVTELKVETDRAGSWICWMGTCRSTAAATEKRAASVHYACSLPTSYSKGANPPSLADRLQRGLHSLQGALHNQFDAGGPRPLPEAILAPRLQGVRIRAGGAWHSVGVESADFAGSDVLGPSSRGNGLGAPSDK